MKENSLSLTISGNLLRIVVPRLVATAISIALAGWAIVGFRDYTASATVRMLAKAIAEGEQPKVAALDQLHESREFDRILTTCNSANLRALAAIHLKEVDLAYVMADPPRAERMGAAAGQTIRRALACAPLDGNLWLRWAALQTAQNGPSAATFEAVRLSYWLAPNDGWITRARVDFSSRLYGAGLKDVEAELRSDIRMLVRFDSNNNIADLLETAPESVRPIYREWIAVLPQGKRNSLARTLERRGNDLLAQ